MIRANKLTQSEGPHNVGENGEGNKEQGKYIYHYCFPFPLKNKRKIYLAILFCVALWWNDFRTIEMIHCFLFHSRNTPQNQGDIYGFQLHTGNTLYNGVLCVQHAYRKKEIRSKENIYQYCFPFPSRATRIVEGVFRLGNTLNEPRKNISFCSASALDVIEIAPIVKFANTLAHLW